MAKPRKYRRKETGFSASHLEHYATWIGGHRDAVRRPKYKMNARWANFKGYLRIDGLVETILTPSGEKFRQTEIDWKPFLADIGVLHDHEHQLQQDDARMFYRIVMYNSTKPRGKPCSVTSTDLRRVKEVARLIREGEYEISDTKYRKEKDDKPKKLNKQILAGLNSPWTKKASHRRATEALKGKEK